MSLNFSSKYQCAACGDDIYSTSLLRVSCCDCPPGLDLCLECFSCRAEVAQHRPDHRYRSGSKNMNIILHFINTGSSIMATSLLWVMTGPPRSSCSC